MNILLELSSLVCKGRVFFNSLSFNLLSEWTQSFNSSIDSLIHNKCYLFNKGQDGLINFMDGILQKCWSPKDILWKSLVCGSHKLSGSLDSLLHVLVLLRHDLNYDWRSYQIVKLKNEEMMFDLIPCV